MKTSILLTIFAMMITFACTSGENTANKTQTSNASTNESAKVQESSRSTTTKLGRPIIGKIKTRSAEITIISGEKGPLYTVRDKNRKIILREAPEDEFKAQLRDIHDEVKKQIAETGWAGFDGTKK